MSGRYSRTKGHSFEREIARLLRPLYPQARRGLQYRDGVEACDVEGTPFHIECKRMKKVDIKKAFAQAKKDCQGKRIPIVISKEDRQEILITLDADGELLTIPFEDWLSFIIRPSVVSKT